MISAINTALSGFNAATQRINVAANNIANASTTSSVDNNGNTTNTPYVPQQVTQSSVPSGGVTTKTSPVNPTFIELNNQSNAASNSSSLTQYPNVDEAQQLVQTQLASYDAQANLSVMKVEDNMFQKVLNIVS